MPNRPHGGRLINRVLEDRERRQWQARAEELPRLQLNPRQISDVELIAIGARSGRNPPPGLPPEGAGRQSPRQRAPHNRLMNWRNKGFTLWFTGLPCSGKSTLAHLVSDEVERRGRAVEVLDAEVVRTHLCKGLGFSKEDRDTNIRRIGFLCELLSRHGVIAIAAAISPYRATREEVRATIESFVEVYLHVSVEVCSRRDVKGMYKRARAGEIKNFTGIDDPYEPPLNPELVLETGGEPPAASAARILAKLEQLQLIEPPKAPAYQPVEAE